MTFRISVFRNLGVLLLGAFLALTPLRLAYAVELAPAIDKSWIKKFETAEVLFPTADSEWATATPGQHPAPVHWLLNKILKWDPQDQDPSPRGSCALEHFASDLARAATPEEKTKLYNLYEQKCESQYIKGSLLSQWQAFRLFSMTYDIDEHPFMHRVVFQLPDGKKLKGLLAIKDNKRRPFVILRMGIMGNIEEAFAERFFYYQLFERSLFNFLMVENMTGSDFIHNNKAVEFGGLAESYQNIWLGQLLRDSKQPLSQLIESLHIVGLSLGGQGVLTAAWLAPVQRNPEIFQSYLALCPLVNLKPTFEFLFKPGLAGWPLEFWAHSRFTEVKDFYPELFHEFFGLPQRVLKKVTSGYKKPKAELFGVKEPVFIAQESDFYKLHELSDWDPKLRKPVWIWVTNQDSIVPVELNTATLPGVDPVRIDVGNHCSFPASWDGRMTQAMFRGHILGKSNFKPGMKTRNIPVQVNENWDLNDVKVEKGGVVDVTLLSEKKKKYNFKMALSELDFDFRSESLTEAEKRMVRRWLSTNLKFTASPNGSGMTVSWPFVTQ